ncbi:uncharacterized protein LOC109603160 isoform X2 [Aethina tumida]|uniref:uncharacterized protein LOC109603160 isoform X2 n=1 Tax=Aethina tumida TaxID=116153 RepID=UPI002148E94A|nr:uncharacterized protein LOC109603160 isoform X2 [Aethina tumida]
MPPRRREHAKTPRQRRTASVMQPPTKNRKSLRQAGIKAAGGRLKTEGNSNRVAHVPARKRFSADLTVKRTAFRGTQVRTGLLNRGIRSRTVRRVKRLSDNRQLRQKIIDEDLAGLLGRGDDDSGGVSRSHGWNRQPTDTPANCSTVISESCTSESTADSVEKQTQSQSQSIFKEINDRYEQQKLDNSGPTRSQFEQLLDILGQSIQEEARKIKLFIIGGPKETNNMTPSVKHCQKEEMNILSFHKLKKSEWIFKTPPRQRIPQPASIESSSMRPAIIYTTRSDKNIYEVNDNINVDLNKVDKMKVPVDNRYMVHVARFENDANLPDIGEDIFDNLVQNDFMDINDAPSSEDVQDHFLSLTCRPKKIVKSIPRTKPTSRMDIFKVKEDEMSYVDDECDMSFVDENDDESEQKPKRFKLDFNENDNQNLDDINMFQFTSPNMFQFAK